MSRSTDATVAAYAKRVKTKGYQVEWLAAKLEKPWEAPADQTAEGYMILSQTHAEERVEREEREAKSDE